MSEIGWTVDDYRTPAGARPVKAFLDGLSEAAQLRVYAALALLEEHGNRLLMPQSRSLGEGLQEMRVRHQEGPFRIIYCFQPGHPDRAASRIREAHRADAEGRLALARARKRVLEAAEGG